VLFVCLGEPDEARAFFERLWPGARAISDPAAEFYAAFGIGRMHSLDLLRPSLWAAGLRALAKGNAPGLPSGDPWVEPGLFLIEGGRVARSHVFRHIGDHADLGEWMALASEQPPRIPP
jgi:hypothetical protein